MLKWSVLKVTQKWICSPENTQALCGSSADTASQEIKLDFGGKSTAL